MIFSSVGDSNGLGMLKRAADDGHLCAGYVHAIILIFKGGESMREGTSFIGNMSIPSLRRCRDYFQHSLHGIFPHEPHKIGERPICCTTHRFSYGRYSCDLCRCDYELDEVVNFMGYFLNE